jgi:hypothetical protein
MEGVLRGWLAVGSNNIITFRNKKKSYYSKIFAGTSNTVD